ERDTILMWTFAVEMMAARMPSHAGRFGMLDGTRGMGPLWRMARSIGSVRHRFLHAVVSITLAFVAHTSVADAQRYDLDPEHLTIGFLVRHLGYADTL